MIIYVAQAVLKTGEILLWTFAYKPDEDEVLKLLSRIKSEDDAKDCTINIGATVLIGIEKRLEEVKREREELESLVSIEPMGS